MTVTQFEACLEWIGSIYLWGISSLAAYITGGGHREFPLPFWLFLVLHIAQLRDAASILSGEYRNYPIVIGIKTQIPALG